MAKGERKGKKWGERRRREGGWGERRREGGWGERRREGEWGEGKDNGEERQRVG